MSELQAHRAAIAPQLMLAELGRVCFEKILLRCHYSPRIGQVHPQAQRAQRPQKPVLPMQGLQDISLPVMPSHQALKGNRSQGDHDVPRLQEETQDGVGRGILYKLRAQTAGRPKSIPGWPNRQNLYH